MHVFQFYKSLLVNLISEIIVFNLILFTLNIHSKPKNVTKFSTNSLIEEISYTRATKHRSFVSTLRYTLHNEYNIELVKKSYCVCF